MSAVQYVRDARAGFRHRPVRWFAAVAAGSLLLAGCGTVPGAGVVVDGTRISEQTVQQRTQALIDEQASDATSVDAATRVLLNRYQATDVVRHQLVLAAADAKHITVTDAQVNGFISKNGGVQQVSQQMLGTVPVDAVHDAIYDYLVLQKLVGQIPDDGVDVTDVQVTADVVQAADRDEAIADRTRYLNDPAAMDADAAAAQSAGTQLSLLADPDAANLGILSAPEGEIVLLAQGMQGYLVVRVTKRTEKSAMLTQDAVQSATSLNGYLTLASLLLTKYSGDVTVNPRFGQWDPQTLQVIPPNNGL